ncbi:MAG TPA: Ig-like domain-containing protein, partial [Acidobacteriaceae bacterium]|nr:Ig-like domain-containing protein [Acidobacteriaceae bacterium]
MLIFLVAFAPAFGQTKTPTTTTLTLTSGGNAVTIVASGTVITLTATVQAAGAAVSPGQVAFCDASATYCTDIHRLALAQLTTAGTATLKLRPGVGAHSYKAVFLGTNANAGSS